MRRLIAAMALAASACGSEPARQPQEPVVNQGAAAQSFQERILALPEPQRLAVFANAIRDSGEDCQQVTRAAPGGTYRGLPVWRATCRGGGIWTIVITDNGGAQVVNAAEAQLVTDPPGNGADAR